MPPSDARTSAGRRNDGGHASGRSRDTAKDGIVGTPRRAVPRAAGIPAA